MSQSYASSPIDTLVTRVMYPQNTPVFPATTQYTTFFCALNVVEQHDSSHFTTKTHYWSYCTNAIHHYSAHSTRHICAKFRESCVHQCIIFLTFYPKLRRHLPTVRIKHITKDYTEAISTLLTHCMNTVHYYCAHCTPQYSTERTVPISMRILRPLHHSILHCAQRTHQHHNTAHTAPLSTPLRAM